MEYSDYQSLRIGGGNCAHVRALAHVSELVVVVVCDGVKADSEVSEAGCDRTDLKARTRPRRYNGDSQKNIYQDTPETNKEKTRPSRSIPIVRTMHNMNL